MNRRLLPWSSENGTPCYLDTDSRDSFLSRLADNLEAVQLGKGRELLRYTVKLLAQQEPSEVELRNMVARLSEALRDAIRVAESRGERLPVTGDSGNARAAVAVIDREIVR
ncbi:hypothetical protein ACFO3J_11960 [Streptomyces polygonati]|uniref:Uncharacterized protein n=1 Tax=Streptomyces polygonati TaxID=1617087 RepID=A0ABV8HJM9_9ACTN